MVVTIMTTTSYIIDGVIVRISPIVIPPCPAGKAWAIPTRITVIPGIPDVGTIIPGIIPPIAIEIPRRVPAPVVTPGIVACPESII
jgi:hypothetical protein